MNVLKSLVDFFDVPVNCEDILALFGALSDLFSVVTYWLIFLHFVRHIFISKIQGVSGPRSEAP